MRDLVIWVSALRIASNEGGAILVSGDRLHTNVLGDAEADRHKLLRIKSLREALQYLDVEASPAGQLIKRLLDPVWQDLVNAGLPARTPMDLRSIKDLSLLQRERGLHAQFRMRATVVGGELRALVTIDTDRGTIASVSTDEISVTIDGRASTRPVITIQPNRSYASTGTRFDERMKALKDAIGEQP